MNEILNLLMQLIREVHWIKAYLQRDENKPVERFKNIWMDGQEVMQSLHISKRTLQALRDNGTIPFSRINGKFYYKTEDIEKMLQANYQPPKSQGHGNK
jgi:hypothetical protein